MALVLLYASTIVIAIIDPTSTMTYLTAALIATIVIPVFLWVMGIFLRLSKKNDQDVLFRQSSTNEDDNSNHN